MRLLPKSEADRLRKEEERQRATEGMRIAERVDTLREIAVTEEQALEQYRISSLGSIQEEIEKSRAERDSLSSEVSILEKRRKILLEPLLDRQLALFLKEENQNIDSEKKSNAHRSAEVEVLRRQNLEKAEVLGKELSAQNLEKLAIQRMRQDAQATEQKAIAFLTKSKQVFEESTKASDELKVSAQRHNKQSEVLRGNLLLKGQELAKKEKELEERELAVLIKELEFYSPVKRNT